MSIINKYRKSGNLVGHWPIRKLTLKDDSGNGYDISTTVTGTPFWKHGKMGTGIAFKNSSYIKVIDNGAAPNLQTTSCFVWWFGEPFQAPDAAFIFKRFLSKKDGGGTDFEFYLNNATSIGIGASANSSLSGITAIGKRFFAARIPSAGLPDFFIDGQFVGTGTSYITKNQNDADLIINNDNTASTNTSNLNAVYDCGVINTSFVPDEDVAQLYEELMAEQSATRVDYSAIGKWPVLQNEIFSSDCDLYNSAMVDFTGNSTGQSVIGNGFPTSVQSPFGTCSKFNGRAYRMTVPHDFTTIPMTVHVLVKEDLKSNNQGTVNQFNSATNKGWFIGHGVTGNFDPLFNLTGDSALNYSFGAVTPGTWNLYTITKPTGGSVAWKYYLNGSYVGQTAVNNNVLNYTNLTIGDRRSATTNPCFNPIGLLKVLNVEQSDTDVAVFYSQIARKLEIGIMNENIAPTLVNVTSGQISNSPFMVNSGTWKESEELVNGKPKHWDESVAVGEAYMHSSAAFGTWVFEMNHNTAANSLVRFIADSKGVYSTSHGYYIVINTAEGIALVKNNLATVTSLMTGSDVLSAGTSYKIAVSRSTLGVFTVYIKGGSYSAWTLLGVSAGTNPVTDTTYTSGGFFTFESITAAGDKFRFLGHHLGTLTINELEAIY